MAPIDCTNKHGPRRTPNPARGRDHTTRLHHGQERGTHSRPGRIASRGPTRTRGEAGSVDFDGTAGQPSPNPTADFAGVREGLLCPRTPCEALPSSSSIRRPSTRSPRPDRDPAPPESPTTTSGPHVAAPWSPGSWRCSRRGGSRLPRRLHRPAQQLQGCSDREPRAHPPRCPLRVGSHRPLLVRLLGPGPVHLPSGWHPHPAYVLRAGRCRSRNRPGRPLSRATSSSSEAGRTWGSTWGGGQRSTHRTAAPRSWSARSTHAYLGSGVGCTIKGRHPEPTRPGLRHRPPIPPTNGLAPPPERGRSTACALHGNQPPAAQSGDGG